MPASFCASFLVFILTGIYAMWTRDLPFQAETVLKVMLFATILVNACFFFFYEVFTESDAETKNRLKKARPFEWWLRVFAQAELFNLWFVLQWGWTAFFLSLSLLYGTYIFWDRYTWKCLANHTVFYLDILGLAASCLALFVFTRLPSHDLQLQQFTTPAANGAWVANDRTYMLMLSIVMFFYLGICLVGLNVLKRTNPNYNLFRDFKENLT
jgi:hypothetical protein